MMKLIVLPPSREEFEAFVRSHFTYRDARSIIKAWIWCGKWHGPQEREDGSCYADHPRAAAWILLREIGVRNPEIIISTLLHDIREIKDHPKPTYKALRSAFGNSIVKQVRALTKYPSDQNVEEYSRQVFAGGASVVIAKFGDRLHNLRTLGVCDQKKRARILHDTWVYYFPESSTYIHFLRKITPEEKKQILYLWRLMQFAILEIEL